MMRVSVLAYLVCYSIRCKQSTSLSLCWNPRLVAWTNREHTKEKANVIG